MKKRKKEINYPAASSGVSDRKLFSIRRKRLGTDPEEIRKFLILTAIATLALALETVLIISIPRVAQAIELCEWYSCLDASDRAQLACYRAYCDEAAREQGAHHGVFQPAFVRASSPKELIPYVCTSVPDHNTISLPPDICPPSSDVGLGAGTSTR
jgi:hypothetical protein